VNSVSTVDLHAPASTRRSLRRCFATIVSASSAPYGYTITIWSSGALLLHYRSAPHVWEVFLFVAGAVAAFAGLWLIGRGAIEHSEPLPQGATRAFAGVLDLFAAGAAVGGAALIATLRSPAAWPLASLAATAIYLTAASLQLAVAERRPAPGPSGHARHPASLDDVARLH
jgi:hypothetical protein